MSTSGLVPLDDPVYLRGLLASMGVSEYDESVITALQQVVTLEYEAVLTTATRVCQYCDKSDGSRDRNTIDYSMIKYACTMHEVMSPPDTQRQMQQARISNARVLAWPLGPDVQVPLHQLAQLHEIRKQDIQTLPPADSYVPVVIEDDPMNGGESTAPAATSTTDSTMHATSTVTIPLDNTHKGNSSDSTVAPPLPYFVDAT